VRFCFTTRGSWAIDIACRTFADTVVPAAISPLLEAWLMDAVRGGVSRGQTQPVAEGGAMPARGDADVVCRGVDVCSPVASQPPPPPPPPRHAQMQWTRAMGAVMERAAAHHGATQAHVHAALASIPIHPGILCTIREVVDAGGRCSILSDANEVFIRSVLAHHGLTYLFDRIVTNPAWFRGDRLVIEPYCPFDLPGGEHGCVRPQCPRNMCKGRLLREVLHAGWAERRAAAAVAEAGGGSTRPATHVMYLGDGTGDLCACMQLGA